MPPPRPDRSAAARPDLVTQLREQAATCSALGSPLYGLLLERCAADLAAGGPVAAVLAGREAAEPGEAVPLRLAGAVHRIVLEGRAPALAAHYPSTGGQVDPRTVWPVFRATVAEHVDEVRAGLAQPPQTNEVGRAAALVGGLAHLLASADLPVRLHEIGASAGLNLRADRFAVHAVHPVGRAVHPGGRVGTAGTVGGPTYGPPDSAVQLADAFEGQLPPLGPAPRVVQRRGSDPAPVDVATPEGRLLLRAYVWPDQPERRQRLDAAIEVAGRVPAELVRQSADEHVAGLDLAEGTWTVLWHSVMWQYVDPVQRERVLAGLDRLGRRAGPSRRLAHLRLEPGRPDSPRRRRHDVLLRTWPGGEDRRLGDAAPHGLPVTWS